MESVIGRKEEIKDRDVIDKEYHEVLLHRIEILRNYLKDDNKSIHLTFITSKGVKPNMYSGIIQNEVTLDDLF